MRTVTGGDGSDTTAAVLSWLASQREIGLANLILIGEPEDPLAQWLTDYESPLNWPYWGTFQPAVIERGSVSSKIGFEAKHRANCQRCQAYGAAHIEVDDAAR